MLIPLNWFVFFITFLIHQVEIISASMGDLQAEHDTMAKRLRQAENDVESGRKAWDAERAMLIERCATATASAASARSPTGKGRLQNTSTGGSYRANDKTEDTDKLIEQLEDQVRSLGQQLLKKQDSMQELLSERAGLKVRLQDAQRRWRSRSISIYYYVPPLHSNIVIILLYNKQHCLVSALSLLSFPYFVYYIPDYSIYYYAN